MPTIREVAQKAGVSFSTVSHVINQTRFVSEETRKRVLAAMAELSYHPNALARSLRSGKTNTLGLILPDSSNPYFAEVGRSVEDVAYQLGYSVILCNTEGDARREQFYVDVLTNKQVDGMIFVAAGDQVDSLNAVLRRGIPVVMIDRSLQDMNVDAVLSDNCQGGYLATRHLVGLGHRRIGCIFGPHTISPTAERVTGYKDALIEAGLPVDPRLITRGDYHPESGRKAALELFGLENPPTAIFSCNDLMALGVLRASAQSGRRVPQDLSIVGFDNIELASYTNPALTTIAQSKAEIGAQAASLLAQRIADKTLPTRRLVLPTQLITRESTCPVSVPAIFEGVPA